MRALSIWASALLLANISVFLYGQTPVQPTSTPLRELIQELERQNPSVIAGQKAYEAARFESKQASALPDTNVMVQHLSVGSPRPFAGYTNSEFAYIGLGAVTSAGWVWFLLPVYGGYTALTDGVGKAWVADLLPEERVGSGLGFYQGLAGGAALLAGVWAGLAWGSSGRLPLFHLDLYRLDTRDQIIGAGLESYFYRPAGVTVVEWAERWFGEEPGFRIQDSGFPASCRFVRIETLGETDRRITYEDFGA